jgi:predicted nucleic acid-binding protein
VSLYLDTSCLLKLLFPEPESARVLELIASEQKVVVSSLARLETLVQIRGREEGRFLTRKTGASLRRTLESLLTRSPFEPTDSPAHLDRIAHAQLSERGRSAHCRTLDRLHLAAMEGLGVRRLMTNDDQQGAAARALGFEVSFPR